MAWFAEEKGFDGEWRPVKYADEPPTGRAEGGKVIRRSVREIPDYFEHLTLQQLRACFSPDGNFYAMNREA